MLPAVTRTATAALTAIALTFASIAPAQALGRNERNVLKGIAAAVILHEIVKQSRSEARPTPIPYEPRPLPPSRPAPVVNAPAAAFHEFSPHGRRLIQQRLAAYGYYRGAIDGVWGRGTANAVAAFARDAGSVTSLSSRDASIQLYNQLIS